MPFIQTITFLDDYQFPVLFLCSVIDSIRYGLPGGAFLFVLFFLHWKTQFSDLTLLRWVVGPLLVTGLSLWMIRQRNKVYFPMKYVWFSGFTVLFAALAVQVVLIMLFSDMFASANGPQTWHEVLYVCFVEFVSQSFIGLFIITAYSILFKKVNPNGN